MSSPGRTLAAAATVGGALVLVFPAYAVTVLQLLLVALAFLFAFEAIAQVVPEWTGRGGWRSPFTGTGREIPHRRVSGGADRIEAVLAERRQPVPGGPWVPSGLLHLIQPRILSALARSGVDPSRPGAAAAARRRVSPETWALLAAEPLRRPSRYVTRRPSPRRVAEVVLRVLGDLDRLRTP
jgi:hypothetical protein